MTRFSDFSLLFSFNSSSLIVIPYHNVFWFSLLILIRYQIFSCSLCSFPFSSLIRYHTDFLFLSLIFLSYFLIKSRGTGVHHAHTQPRTQQDWQFWKAWDVYIMKSNGNTENIRTQYHLLTRSLTFLTKTVSSLFIPGRNSAMLTLSKMHKFQQNVTCSVPKENKGTLKLINLQMQTIVFMVFFICRQNLYQRS